MKKLQDKNEAILIGARLRRIRNKQSLFLQQVADRLGVAYQQVQKYETGKDNLTVSAMNLFAEALEVDACEICGCQDV